MKDKLWLCVSIYLTIIYLPLLLLIWPWILWVRRIHQYCRIIEERED